MEISVSTDQEPQEAFINGDENQSPEPGNTGPSLNASRDYLHLLTRISAHGEPQIQIKPCYDGIFDIMFKQPLEIRQLIISWLESTDLLNLRMTSHSLHTLVHDSERAICADLSEHISSVYDLHHLSIPITDLSTYFTAVRSYHAIRGVSDILSTRICDSLSPRSPSTKGEGMLLTVRSRAHSTLKSRLSRSFIILQHYLNFVLMTMIENESHLASLDDDDYGDLLNIFDLDQQKFLANNMPGLTESDFVDITASWDIFKAVCKAKLIPLNLKIHASWSTTVKQIFIYNGFAPFAKSLAPDAQPDALKAILEQLYERHMRQSLKRDYTRLESIHHLSICNEVLKIDFLRRRTSKAREAYINHQDIWNRSARALMMQKLGKYPIVMSAPDWIADIMSSIEKGDEMIVGRWNTA